MRGIGLVISQFVGAFIGQCVSHYILYRDIKDTPYGATSFHPSENFHIASIIISEIIAVMILTASISQRSTFFNIVVSTFFSSLIAVPVNLGCLNPFQAFTNHLLVAKFPSNHWIFWVGPIAGALLGRIGKHLIIIDSNLKSSSLFMSDSSSD